MASFKSLNKIKLLEFSKTAIKKGDILKHFNIGHNKYNLQQLNEFLLDNNLLNNFKTNWYKPKSTKIIKQYKYYCSICNKGFNFKSKIIDHYIQQHNLSKESAIKQFYFYDKGLDFPKCPYCGNDVSLRRYEPCKTCSNPECRGKYNTERQKEWYKNHPEEREKRSKQRVEYLKNKQNFENTAWGKRASGKMSFLEQWFVDNIIIPYNLGNKYDIINELTVSRYFLDFAFTNIKLDVELDGRCHFKNGELRVQHDLDRDKFLENLNWKIYRISYKDIENIQIKL